MPKYIWDYMYDNVQNAEFKEQTKNVPIRKTPLEMEEYADAVILPWRKETKWGLGGIVDNKGNFVEASKKVPKEEVASFFGGSYEYDFVEKSEEAVVYMGPFKQHWGHFIVDCLTRAWWLTTELKENMANAKIAFLNIGDEQLEDLYLQVLELLGIQGNKIVKVTKPTQFSKVYLPEEAYVVGEYWTDEFKRMFQHIAEEACSRWKGETFRKIYFSRGKWKLGRQKGEYGEKEIERVFEKNGYTIICPEQLSVIEQIALIGSAEEIVSPMGTVAHAVALFQRHLKKFIICNKFYLHVPHQLYLNEMLDAEVIYIDTYYSKTPGIYWMGINRNLKRFIQDYNYEIPFSKGSLFIIYIANAIRYYMKKFMVPVYKRAAKVRNKLKGKR